MLLGKNHAYDSEVSQTYCIEKFSFNQKMIEIKIIETKIKKYRSTLMFDLYFFCHYLNLVVIAHSYFEVT